MGLQADECEENQKLQVKDTVPSANMSDIHTTMPANSQSSRRFRARSCKVTRPAEKILIDLTEDDNNDMTAPLSGNEKNENVVHLDDACDKDEFIPGLGVSKVVKGTPYQVPKADVQELQRGSDMHEFLLCLGSNVLKDITTNGGCELANANYKSRASITKNLALPVNSRLEKTSPCYSGWDNVNEHTLATETPHSLVNNKVTTDSSIDDGWGMTNEDLCNAIVPEKMNSNSDSWGSASKENKDTYWGISSQNALNDDGWGMAIEDTHKVTGQEKSAFGQNSWSGTNETKKRDFARDGNTNCLDWTKSGHSGKIGSTDDTYGDKMKENERRSGKYAPSGSNLVPLGKRKLMIDQPAKERSCDSGWDAWKGVDIESGASPTKGSPSECIGKVERNSSLEDGWGMPSNVLSAAGQENFGQTLHADDGWGMPIEDARKATADDGWGMQSADLGKSTRQEYKPLIQPSQSLANAMESRDYLNEGSTVDGWGMPNGNIRKDTADDGWGMRGDDLDKSIIQENGALSQPLWNTTNSIESRGNLNESPELCNADTDITTVSHLGFINSERRNPRELRSPMNDSDGDNVNVDRRRSGKYAPSGANLVPLGKRKSTNGLVVKETFCSKWTSIDEDTGCNAGWEDLSKPNKVTNLTTESPSFIGQLETDLPCDDGWGLSNEGLKLSKESLDSSWGCMKKDSYNDSLWGNSDEDATDNTKKRDMSLFTPSQDFGVSHLEPMYTSHNPLDSDNLEGKGEHVHMSTIHTFSNKTKRKYQENEDDERRGNGRYELSGATPFPLGKRESGLHRRYGYLWDQSTCPNEPSEAFNAVKTLANSMHKILHQSGYAVGDKLSAEDQKEVIENALSYHPDKDNKIGCGVEYIMIDTAPEHQNANCFFIVRKDGSRSDFSYWKCINGFVQDKYPDHANEVV